MSSFSGCNNDRYGNSIEEGTSGVVQSPNYPNGLAHRMYCMWFIRGPDDRRIKVDFEDLDFPTTTAWIHPHTNRTYHWCKTGVRVSISSLVLHTVICIQHYSSDNSM